MAEIDFMVENVPVKTDVKFWPNTLPDPEAGPARKPYIARPANQAELDIHQLASQADTFNITVSPATIEEGMTAGMRLIFYLLARGYKINIGTCTFTLTVPGEYEGHETRLPPDVFAKARVHINPAFQQSIGRTVDVNFDGFAETNGFIAEAVDESDGSVNRRMTENAILTIHGYGLKIMADAAHEAETGLFFEPVDESSPTIKASVIAVNEPKTLKVVVPPEVGTTKSYYLKIVTQSPLRGNGKPLKDLREIRSAFTLKAVKR